MTRTANWSPYTGNGSIILTIALLVITGLLILAAVRLSHPIAFKRPGVAIGSLIVVIWLLSVCAFLVAATEYARVLVQQVGKFTGPADPITPVTMTLAVLTFPAILFLTRRSGFWVAVGSAIAGTIAAPLIFELPFDLIVLWRTFPPTPASLFTSLYFFPLFLIEISSYAMVMLSPMLRLSRYTLLALAAMFLIFAVWAVFGFAYPSTPFPTAMNMLSKVMAFVAAVSLFLPESGLAPMIRRARQSAPASALTPQSSGLI